MKNIFFGLIFFFCGVVLAQNTISGTLSPAKDYSWLLVYQLKPGKVTYVSKLEIKEGLFSIELPANSPIGTYRFVYAIPQEEYYFDVLYNGKEDIALSFSTENGVAFTSSKENILFTSYFKEINDAERSIISYYTSGSTSTSKYTSLIKKLKNIQSSYVAKSKDLIAGDFIKANTPYIPKAYETVQEYIANKKKNYFNTLDFSNVTLQASNFLTDKVVNYVFTALPLETVPKEETEKEMQNNVRKVAYYTQSISDNYRLSMYYNLWSQAAASSFDQVSDFIYANYLKELATAAARNEIISGVELHNRLRIGAVAPNITWEDTKGKKKTLHTIDGNINYVVVFWSSTCSHCLKELPILHEQIKKYPNTKVIAVGVEDSALNWKIETTKLPNFEHALALGKWESKYVKLYAINQTPSYFVLDKDKRFIAKPEDNKAVIDFFN